jgi:hypothetical protein
LNEKGRVVGGGVTMLNQEFAVLVHEGINVGCKIQVLVLCSLSQAIVLGHRRLRGIPPAAGGALCLAQVAKSLHCLQPKRPEINTSGIGKIMLRYLHFKGALATTNVTMKSSGLFRIYVTHQKFSHLAKVGDLLEYVLHSKCIHMARCTIYAGCQQVQNLN